MFRGAGEPNPLGSTHTMRSRQEFRNIWKSVRSDNHFYPMSILAAQCKSRNSSVRLRALLKMRQQLNGGVPKGYFRLAKKLVADRDNDCRWQAIIVVGEYIRTHPASVWRIIERYGSSDDEDMRAAIATVLLEHLLEGRFRTYHSRARRKANQSEEFADTLRRCWLSGRELAR
jgi:hypothetical protein